SINRSLRFYEEFNRYKGSINRSLGFYEEFNRYKDSINQFLGFYEEFNRYKGKDKKRVRSPKNGVYSFLLLKANYVTASNIFIFIHFLKLRGFAIFRKVFLQNEYSAQYLLDPVPNPPSNAP